MRGDKDESTQHDRKGARRRSIKYAIMYYINAKFSFVYIRTYNGFGVEQKSGIANNPL